LNRLGELPLLERWLASKDNENFAPECASDLIIVLTGLVQRGEMTEIDDPEGIEMALQRV